MPYWYHGRNGDSFVDATLHADRDCPDAPIRPVADSTVAELDAPNYCAACVPAATREADTDTDADDDTDADGNTDTDTDTAGDTLSPDEIETAIENEACPWCPDDGYTGPHVGQHASSAHPDAWGRYRDE
jgi:hypothetical protein